MFKLLKERLFKKISFRPKSREELLTAIHSAQQERVLDSDAEGMLAGVLQVSEMQIRDIMVPRSQMVLIEETQNLADIIGIVTEAQHSRYPVMDNAQTEVKGILLAKDLLRFTTLETQPKFSLRKMIQPALIVPETQHLDTLLKLLKTRRSHMAIVVDEFGHIAGLITMEDVLEQIVGEIDDESDYDDDVGIKQFEDYYIVKADLALTEFDDYFRSKLNHADCESVGGLVIKNLGYIPKRNEEFAIHGFHFKVLHADKRRVRLLQITKPLVAPN